LLHDMLLHDMGQSLEDPLPAPALNVGWQRQSARPVCRAIKRVPISQLANTTTMGRWRYGTVHPRQTGCNIARCRDGSRRRKSGIGHCLCRDATKIQRAPIAFLEAAGQE
jgi:hypothetical protein